MPIDPDEVQVGDGTPGQPEFVRPTDPLTEWTGRRILEAIVNSDAAAPLGAAVASKQDTQITAEQAILAKLTADPATQTTLAAILAKIIVAPATETTLAEIATDTDNLATLVAKDFATQTTVAAILAKIISAPATETTLAEIATDTDNLATLVAKDFATQTTLAAVLAKLTADPATQTTLAAVLAKIIAAPATEAKQDTQITAEQAILAKQPSLGTSTAPSANVITTQRPSVTQVVSTALEASKVLKNAAGQLVQLSVFNSKGSAQFILLINATSVPGDGAVTLLYPPIPIAANTLLVLDLPAPLVASTGICVSNSTTGTFTKTIGVGDCAFYAQVN